jgi:hypothetical protein
MRPRRHCSNGSGTAKSFVFNSPHAASRSYKQRRNVQVLPNFLWRAIACNGRRQPWHLWHLWQSEICNLRTAKGLKKFDPHQPPQLKINDLAYIFHSSVRYVLDERRLLPPQAKPPQTSLTRLLCALRLAWPLQDSTGPNAPRVRRAASSTLQRPSFPENPTPDRLLDPFYSTPDSRSTA